MNEEIMIRHYEKTPKETLIKILVVSRKEVDKLQNRNKERKQEIERLNNIINGMEKFFQYAYDNEVREINDRKVSVWTICLDKLQELKGSNSNE